MGGRLCHEAVEFFKRKKKKDKNASANNASLHAAATKEQRTDPSRIPEHFLRPSGLVFSSCPWPDQLIREFILSGKVGPFYPPNMIDGEDENEECGVCFYRHTHGLNRCKGCQAGVCSECYLQICKPVPGIPLHAVHLGERAKCPFCGLSPYATVFRVLSEKERQALIEEKKKVETLEGAIVQRKHIYESHVAEFQQLLSTVQQERGPEEGLRRLPCCEWTCTVCSLQNVGQQILCGACRTPGPGPEGVRQSSYRYTIMLPGRTVEVAFLVCQAHDHPVGTILDTAFLRAGITSVRRGWRLGTTEPCSTHDISGIVDALWAVTSATNALTLYNVQLSPNVPSVDDGIDSADVIVDIDGVFHVWSRDTPLNEQCVFSLGRVALHTAIDRPPHLEVGRPVNMTQTPRLLGCLHGDIFFTTPEDPAEE